MPALSFDGVDDFVEWTSLTSALQNIPLSDMTMVSVTRTTFTGVSLVVAGMLTATPNWCLYHDRTTINAHSLSGSATGTGWPGSVAYGIAVSRFGGGASAPKWYTKNLSTDAVVLNHSFTSSINDGAACSQIELGRLMTGSYWSGHMGVFALFDYYLSDAEKEECFANKQTSDIANCSGGPPVMLVELTTTSPTDLMGNASGFVNNGPTVDSAQTMNDWNFDALGNNDPPQIVRPDADITTTGWSTSPIFSKVNDNADGTVVTGALS